MNFFFFFLGVGKALWSEKLASPSHSPLCVLSSCLLSISASDGEISWQDNGDAVGPSDAGGPGYAGGPSDVGGPRNSGGRSCGRTLVMREDLVMRKGTGHEGGPHDAGRYGKERRPAGPERQGLSLRMAASGAFFRELSSLESRFSVCLCEALVSAILVFITNLG